LKFWSNPSRYPKLVVILINQFFVFSKVWWKHDVYFLYEIKEIIVLGIPSVKPNIKAPRAHQMMPIHFVLSKISRHNFTLLFSLLLYHLLFFLSHNPYRYQVSFLSTQSTRYVIFLNLSFYFSLFFGFLTMFFHLFCFFITPGSIPKLSMSLR
jgi:hypothetical protein